MNMAENSEDGVVTTNTWIPQTGFGVAGQETKNVDPCSSQPVVLPCGRNTREKMKLPRLKPRVFAGGFESKCRKAGRDSCSDLRLHPSVAKLGQVALAGLREKGDAGYLQE